jgi:hypothetical protein
LGDRALWNDALGGLEHELALLIYGASSLEVGAKLLQREKLVGDGDGNF